MSVTGLLYLMVKVAEFFIMLYSGKYMACSESKILFWKIAIVPIITFAFVDGLRWGHMVDYNVYADVYKSVDNFLTYSFNSSPLFTIIVYSLKKMGCSFPFFLTLQSGFLMFSGIYLLQDFKPFMKWILPCLLLCFPNENFVRFCFGLSFVFIALYHWSKGKYMQALLFYVMGVLVHFALVPVVFYFLFSNLLNLRRIPSTVVLLLFFITSFFMSISNMKFIVSISDYIVHLFGENEYKLFNYLSHMEDTINGMGGANLGMFKASYTTILKNIIVYVPIIFIAPKWITFYEKGVFIYNTMAICVILGPLLSQVELLGRFVNALYIYCGLVMAVTFSLYEHYFHNGIRRTNVVLALSLFCFFYTYINAPFVRYDYEMYFIWDSKGKLTNWAPYISR